MTANNELQPRALANAPLSRQSRPRFFYLVLLLTLPPVGMGLRDGGSTLPSFLVTYGPDKIWAVLVFALTAFLLPRRVTWMVATIGLIVAWGVEFSQLYHTPWLDAVRHTPLGALLLGRGFLATDLACYAAGIGLGALLDWTVTDIHAGAKE